MSTTGSAYSENWIDCTTVHDASHGYEVQMEVMGERARTRHRQASMRDDGAAEERLWIDGPPPSPKE